VFRKINTIYNLSITVDKKQNTDNNKSINSYYSFYKSIKSKYRTKAISNN